MTRRHVIGVDPGPVPGLVVLGRAGVRPAVVQCTDSIAAVILDGLIGDAECIVAIEEFVVGPRAARSSSPGAGRNTRDLIGALAQTAADRGALVARYRAADVMPWATDRRLDAAGLLDATKGMRHARAAARHALYAAVRVGGHPDPLAPRTAGSPAAGARSDRSPTRKGPRP